MRTSLNNKENFNSADYTDTTLQHLRTDKALWPKVAFQAGHDEQYGTFDLNSKKRYVVMVELQYDWRAEDYELVRYLFEQEIIARQEDSFQGIGEVLELGSYLLAKYLEPSDIRLFYKAKHANFDTSCGYDIFYMYLALREKTEDYLQEYHPNIYEDVKGRYQEVADYMDKAWSNFSQSYVNSYQQEEPYALFYRYTLLEDMGKAHHYLEKWATGEKDSNDKFSRLKYDYKSIGCYADAVEMAKKLLPETDNKWDQACALRDLIELHRLAGQYVEGGLIVQQLGKLFTTFDEWHGIGLGRMAMHEAFELSLATDDKPLGLEIFHTTNRWYKTNPDMAYVGLEAASKAAEKWELVLEAHTYKELAQKERLSWEEQLE